MTEIVRRFRPAAAEVEAVQWDGSAEVLTVLEAWGAEPVRFPGMPLRVWGARDGYAGAREDDWLVRDKLRAGAARYSRDDFEAAFEAPDGENHATGPVPAVPATAGELARRVAELSAELAEARGELAACRELDRDLAEARQRADVLMVERDGALSVLDGIRDAHRKHPGPAEFGIVVEEILHREFGCGEEPLAGIRATAARAVAVERGRIRDAAAFKAVTFWRPGNGPAHTQALEVVPLEDLLRLLEGGGPT